MTTMLLIHSHPVALVGATRWYPTPSFVRLDERQQETVAAVCRLLLVSRATSGGSAPADAKNP